MRRPQRRSIDWRYHIRMLVITVLSAVGFFVLVVLLVILSLSLGIWHIHDQ